MRQDKMTACEPFFTEGDAKDQAYVNVRDELRLAHAKSFTEALWQKSAPYLDPDKRRKAKDQFLQNFWEMYLTCTLLEQGFEPKRVGGEGPEYYVEVNNRRVWIEAMAPEAGTHDDRVPEITYGEACPVPTEQILLRFTSALDTKNRQYKRALEKGIVKQDEPIILAINSRAIPHAPYGAELPYFLKAFLPIGNLQTPINPESMECIEASYQYKDNILKANGSPVHTNSFLNLDFAHFTAVIHSGVDCVNHPASLGADFSVLHNPKSTFQLPEQLFSWCRQFSFKDWQLLETSVASSVF